MSNRKYREERREAEGDKRARASDKDRGKQAEKDIELDRAYLMMRAMIKTHAEKEEE